MRRLRLRAVAIALFAVGAVAAFFANASHRGWLGALAFSCLGLGMIAFGRWRQAERARVFDREEKTPE